MERENEDKQNIDIKKENQEWIESLEYIFRGQGADRVQDLLNILEMRVREFGINLEHSLNTPYINTIPVDQQAIYPGNREIERRIKS
ncbi:MAG: hypothetical protein ABIJ45_05995, partial [Candidatus Zixiibacteriota bacterium]